ncbi:unnamed protein product [Triticum turgidum subsp. durum]|uniref:Small ribosomal subunit protein uS2c n=1 Tax=Triticum turgidum subsp. durum TaxID=4567 RepID=A0A9R0ZIQ4_TRITD|nr:unnamed protein product [Triticum turgidum subsp. durum]
MARRYWNINLKEMIEAGVHFGHGIKKWNPKMAPYILAKRKGTHIINLATSQGKSFLIVGTKKRATDLVASATIRARCHYINENWFSDVAILKRKLSTLQRYLSGIKYMTILPDIVVVLDQEKEYIALQECAILGIPTISLVDTNCDPDLANISIPANDDTMTSIRLILKKLVFSIFEGRSLYIRNR